MSEKSCTKCKETKPFSEFSKGKDKYGLYTWCRKCLSNHTKSKYVRRPRTIRLLEINGDVATVPGTKGYSALIDSKFAGEVGKYNWRTYVKERTSYLQAEIPNKTGIPRTVTLHKLIGQLAEWECLEVDHIDPSNGLDCRLTNLRPSNHIQNSYNRRRFKNNKSGIKGVYFKDGKWMAQISAEGQTFYLGTFEDLKDAEQVLAIQRNLLHGEFANHGS